MKRYEIKNEARDFGCKCDWYNHENLKMVEKVNPVRPVGRYLRPAAFFIVTVERVYNECYGWEEFRRPFAGPYATKEFAQAVIDNMSECPF